MKQRFIIVVCVLVLAGCSRSIPDFRVSADDSAVLIDLKGRVLYQGKLFSGYLEEYYPDGSLKSSQSHYNGKKHGEFLGYYPSGALMFSRPYEGGEKEGVHRGFYPDGSRKFIYHFENGLSEGHHQDWYADGQPAKSFRYVNGKPFGAQKVWRSDGKLRANYVIREDGRKYGLAGMKRCKNLDTENEVIAPLTAEIYEK